MMMVPKAANQDVNEDGAKLDRHVLNVRGEGSASAIGEMLLTDVRARHIADVVERMQTARNESGEKKYAP